ncbi:thiopeptide-type bacteriocin biosynthesis domain-containing protein [Promicromonospora umidemergens]|uniref:lantibiotic dehydratase n=1 Tax=Promicromonospora umidemergens TaxID=629679 RepID=UPI0020A422F0|nr:lantibiotic dehydratase [Promicromonospora umidemergens]MCP2286554.1 thiopeptide-type bacteriocin biosynthesis domain-containing protein [Promicromonospora umidemergens]
MRAWLTSAWRESFAAAIELASPSLAAQTRKVLDDPLATAGDLDRVARALGRYARRAASRVTPFGLFAGVAPVAFGPTTKVRLGQEHTACPRPDGQWVADVVGRLESDPTVLQGLSVVANELAFVRDGRLVLDHRPDGGNSRHPNLTEVSVALTEPVLHTMVCARGPIRFADLAQAAVGTFPDAQRADAERMITALVERGFLVTSLRPSPAATNPVAHIAGELDESRLQPLVAEVRNLAERFQIAPAVASGGSWRELAERMRTIQPHERPVGVDTLADVDLMIPTPVIEEAERTADLLMRLAPEPDGRGEWRDYHSRFLERYGPHAVVPLLELLGDTGLGYPATFRGTRLPAPRHESTRDRDGILAALAQRAALERQVEIDLDDALIERVASQPPRVAQAHTELRFEVQAATAEQVDAGDFTLVVAGAARAAGTTTGRFWHLREEASIDQIRDAYRSLPTSTRDALVAQVVVRSLNVRAENVSASPMVLPYVICPDGVTPPGTEPIRLDDLAVTADREGLTLIWTSRGVSVEPVTFTAIELTQAAHPLMRFLCEIPTARAAACTAFDWGTAAALPFLPRARRGHTVLSPARWIVTTDDVGGTGADGVHASLDSWRDRMMVPSGVLLVDMDRRLRLHLDDAADRTLLLEHLAQNDTAVLHEAPPPGALGWIDDRPHELVIPLGSHTPTRSLNVRPALAASGTSTTAPHMPLAGDWLYAKVYGHPDKIDPVLIDHLPRLLDGLGAGTRWWYLPYTDPDPHLRLRIEITEHTAEHVAHQTGRWAQSLRDQGLMSHLVLDTYQPETGRFGTGTTLAAAERFFAADSAAARLQRAATIDAPLAVRKAMTAASLVGIAAVLVGEPDAAVAWLLAKIPRTPSEPPERTTRARAITWTRHVLDEYSEPDDPQRDPQIAEAWQARHSALTEYRSALLGLGTDPAAWIPDLFHLHVIRMLGLLPGAEGECLHLARAGALAWNARRLHEGSCA